MSAERVRIGRGTPPIRAAGVLARDPAADPGDPPADLVDVAVDRARAEAFAAGLRQGRAQAQAEAAGALVRAAETLERQRRAACDSLAGTAVELAVEIARELLRAEVHHGRHDVERMVRDTLESSSAGRARCVVHLNPADLAALEGVPFRSGTVLQPDIGVARGDVHVETSLGLMVRELDGALAAIAEDLRGMLR